MAGTTGSPEFDALIRLLRATSAEAVPAAENAAAVVYRDAAIAAATVLRKSGDLAASIKIIEGRPQKTLMGDTRNRLFVGPEKKKGYYGYFVEKGHRSPLGSAVTHTSRGDRYHRPGEVITTRRLTRAGGKAPHSQIGLTTSKTIGAHPWFEPSQRAADGRAEQAATQAFNAKLQELDSKG